MAEKRILTHLLYRSFFISHFLMGKVLCYKFPIKILHGAALLLSHSEDKLIKSSLLSLFSLPLVNSITRSFDVIFYFVFFIVTDPINLTMRIKRSTTLIKTDLGSKYTLRMLHWESILRSQGQ